VVAEGKIAEARQHETNAGVQATPLSKWLVAGFVVAAAGLFLCYLRQAGTVVVNADAASQALQAWDLLHGNLLLHGWRMSDVSFYTTELPEYAIIEAGRGLRPDVVHIATAATYTLMVVLAAMLARGKARGRPGLICGLLAAGIMLAPALGRDTGTMLGGPNHTGTAVPILLVLLLVDRAPARWWVAAAAGFGLAWTQVADPLTLYAAIIPVAVVAAYRALRWRSWFDTWLAIAVGLAVVAARVALTIIRAAGGFTVNAVPGRLLAPLSAVPHHAFVTGQSVLMLFGADFWDHQTTLSRNLAIVHLVGVALVLAGLLVGAGRFFGKLDRIPQILTCSLAALLAAGVFGTHLADITFAHEIAPVVPLGSALAGRMLGGRFAAAMSGEGRRTMSRLGGSATRAAAWGLGGLLAVYIAGLGYGATRPALPAANVSLTNWLESRGLTTGLSGFWEGSSVMLDSRFHVHLAVLRPDGTAVYQWETNSAWYDATKYRATFVIAAPALGSPTAQPDFPAPPVENVRRFFGKPTRIFRVDGYYVLVYDYNLLKHLAGG
jgi:hypothetical protein